ncbi:hypothetical protein YC2023_059932 [Brassica napus]
MLFNNEEKRRKRNDPTSITSAISVSSSYRLISVTQLQSSALEYGLYRTPVRAEAQAWQARASAQEAAATSLQAQLQQAVDMRGGGGVWAQDGRAEEEGLLCAVGNIGLEDKGSDGGDVAVSASKYLPGM